MRLCIRPAIAFGLALGFTAALSAQWLTYPTPGIPRLRSGAPNLEAPAPKTPDGKPDLSGLWGADCPITSDCWQQSLFFDLARDIPPGSVVMTPWAAGIQKQRESRDHVDDPLGYCLPPGVPRVLFYRPFKILSTPGVTAFLHETDIGPLFRQVFTDGRPFPPMMEPAWFGYSVGRWEGDAFVIETAGFKDGGWLDTRKGRPHSDAMRVTERFRRRDFGHLDLTLTIADPKAFVKPWTTMATFTFLADTELLEGSCDNHQKTLEHRRLDPAPPEPPSTPPPGVR